MRKRGFSAVEIVTNWREIVGPELAAETSPDRLAFSRGARGNGTLHVTAPGTVALEIQHLEPLILERINTYFGYRAVNRIALSQAPVSHKPKVGKTARAAPRRVAPSRGAAIDVATDNIRSEELREALRRLGKSIATDPTNRPEGT